MRTAADTPRPDLFAEEDEQEAERLDAEALAEADAQGWISGEAVKRWLRSWGKPDELPPPQVGN